MSPPVLISLFVIVYCLNLLDLTFGSLGMFADGVYEGRRWFFEAYLIGSIPFSVLIPKLLGKADPRTVGSKNPGTTNVYRASGMVCALCVAISDILKGMIPVYLALHYIKDVGSIAAVWVGLGCVIGHLWSIFLGGKGGKGVATSAGVLLPFMPLTILVAIILWIIMTKYTRYAVLATGMCVIIVLTSSAFSPHYPPHVLCSLVFSLGALIMLKHRDNIRRFMQGKEHKITRISKADK